MILNVVLTDAETAKRVDVNSPLLFTSTGCESFGSDWITGC